LLSTIIRPCCVGDAALDAQEIHDARLTRFAERSLPDERREIRARDGGAFARAVDETAILPERTERE